MKKVFKICLVCHREFSNRKKWKGIWDSVMYCSKNCRYIKNKKKL
ncbi:DUF2256 domain-containing protein [bacterium]|nr:DUF2256 domain-containing protein [bacterium]MBT3850529.1 DUF2256 domain-containing protein [bacterium]MBT4435008.1 DUF2256 domain-containing protein [bacterium]MDG2445939.1 DUF2256 domain-containing protein [Thermodesulfobacteriota bacterium]